MKKYITQHIIALILVCGTIAQAQITANLVLNNRPPAYLSDWGNGRAGQLIITNTSVDPLEMVIVTQILNESGDIIAQTNPNLARPILINSRTQIIRLDQVLQLGNLKFSDAVNGGQDPDRSMATSGKLPPGVYTLSIEILQAKTGRVLAKRIERRFSQVNYVLPFLLSPQNESWLDVHSAQSAIIFRWSGLVPQPQESVTYKLTVFEIQANQTPMQALRSNMPILNVDITRLTQYIWRPQLDLISTSPKTFIWTVQTFDLKSQFIESLDANTQGRSEPRMFGICNSKEVNKSICGEGFDWTSNTFIK